MKEEFKRDPGFGDLPHYYDEDFNEFKSLDGLFVKELCPVCKAHLSHTGICLNACHFPKLMKERFARMMVESADKVAKEEGMK